MVGFQGDRLYLMPSSDVFGLTPGAKVIPWDSCRGTSRSRQRGNRRRRASDQAWRFPVGDGLLGTGARWSRAPIGWARATEGKPGAPLASQPLNPLDREPINQILDVGVRAINALADRRTRPAHGPVRRLRRREKRAARHDGALYQRRRDRGRPDRRARPRGQGIHRANPWARRVWLARWWSRRRPIPGR